MEGLRKLHDEGRAHGAVTPDAIALTPAGLDLLPAVPGPRIITPYTAPEVAADHRPADSRSDMFAFGVVLFEMLTERRAFEGENEAALVISLASAPMPPSGSPAVDRLIAGCVAKDPARSLAADAEDSTGIEAADRGRSPRRLFGLPA